MHDQELKVLKIFRVIQGSTGAALGFFLYIHGMFLFEKLGGDANPWAIKATAAALIAQDIAILFLELPTGAIADHFGRRAVVIWSLIFRGLMGFFYFLACFAETPLTVFALAMLANLSYGVGLSLQSGSITAWVVDSLRVAKVKEGHGHIISRAYPIFFSSQFIGVLVSFFLYKYGFAWIAFAIVLLSNFYAAFYCHHHMKETEGMNFYQGAFSWEECFRGSFQKIRVALRVFITYPAVFYLCLLYAAFIFLNHLITFLWPVYLKANFGFEKTSSVWIAALLATIGMGYLGTRFMIRVNTKYKQNGTAVPNAIMRQILVCMCFMVVLPVFALGFLSSRGYSSATLLIVSAATIKLGYGIIRPAYDILVNNYIPPQESEHRATVMSVAGMMLSILVMTLTIPSGGESGAHTAQGWLIPAVLITIVAFVANRQMRKAERVYEAPKPVNVEVQIN